MKKFDSWIAVALLVAGAQIMSWSSHETEQRVPLSGPDFKGANFKTGRPATGETLESAFEWSETSDLRSLVEDAETLKRNPGIRVRIEGFTDDVECVEQACYELALRRATLVYDWFVAYGIDKKYLVGPTARRSGGELDFNDYPEGRQRNRRVEVTMVDFVSETAGQ